MALPFWWIGSPAHYGAFGGAIVVRESPRSLDPTECDGEPLFFFVRSGNRLVLAEIALRLSMIATLGPNSINDKKISSWSTHLYAHGLSCYTQHCTVSMPSDKTHKSLNRIAEPYHCQLCLVTS
ncbi:hypothetical protein GQ600_7051 [Phytophthora cactorum]|nr:hypothetical protein GQ600_7051 [Phytophthora cactorum]